MGFECDKVDPGSLHAMLKCRYCIAQNLLPSLVRICSMANKCFEIVTNVDVKNIHISKNKVRHPMRGRAGIVEVKQRRCG